MRNSLPPKYPKYPRPWILPEKSNELLQRANLLGLDIKEKRIEYELILLEIKIKYIEQDLIKEGEHVHPLGTHGKMSEWYLEYQLKRKGYKVCKYKHGMWYLKTTLY